MIRRHDFDSHWWGAPVGIVDEPGFFQLAPRKRACLLGPFAWAQHKVERPFEADARALAAAGFFQADTRLPFRIDLRRVAPGDGELVLEFADATPFAIEPGESAPFEHERFRWLPGASPERITGRYLDWASQLIAQEPAWCVRIRAGESAPGGEPGEVQGWFLARPRGGALDLTLAMLHRKASVSGALLYRAALHAFAERGARIGRADFSASNAAVHNIYASLGARFGQPHAWWLWLAQDAGAEALRR